MKTLIATAALALSSIVAPIAAHADPPCPDMVQVHRARMQPLYARPVYVPPVQPVYVRPAYAPPAQPVYTPPVNVYRGEHDRGRPGWGHGRRAWGRAGWRC